MPIERRAEVCLWFLAACARFAEIDGNATAWEQCKERVAEKKNERLWKVLRDHGLTNGPKLGEFLGKVQAWGMGRYRNREGVPSAEEFAAEAERLLLDRRE